MKIKEITPQEYIILKSRFCDRGKHKMRTNEFGVTWCIICGCLGKGFGDDKVEERLVIKQK